jgi:hypothetical protein
MKISILDQIDDTGKRELVLAWMEGKTRSGVAARMH